MNWRLRLFLACGFLYTSRGAGWVAPTPFGRRVARWLGLWPQQVRWDVEASERPVSVKVEVREDVDPDRFARRLCESFRRAR